jgi:hypothetical protein
MVAMILTVVNRLKELLDATNSTFRKSGAKANSIFRKSTFGKSRAKLKSKL